MSLKRGAPLKPGSVNHRLDSIIRELIRIEKRLAKIERHLYHVEHEVEEIEDSTDTPSINLEAHLVKGVAP